MLSLPQTCATCAYFDHDKFCALPPPLQPMRGYVAMRLITGYISSPERVVCDLHAPKTDPEAHERGV